jgi:hypothetical protein
MSSSGIRPLVESEANVRAVLSKNDISSTEYGILIDLSDTTNFPHNGTNRIDLSHVKVVAELAANSVGAVKLGVITAITATNADMSWVYIVPFEKSASRRILSLINFSPSQLKLGVDGGALQFIITNNFSTSVTAVNSATNLNSPRGTSTVTPAVGDVIIQYKHDSGSAWDALVSTFYHSH